MNPRRLSAQSWPTMRRHFSVDLRYYIDLGINTYTDELVVGFIDLLDIIQSDSGDAVVTVLGYADQTVGVNVHHLVVSINESLHGLQMIGKGKRKSISSINCSCFASEIHLFLLARMV